VELHKGAPRNIVTVLTTTMADVGEGKTANTHMYAKSVAGLILRDCTDNHIKERVNQSLTTDQRTTMSPIKNELLPSPKVVTPIHPELIKHYLVVYDKTSTNFLFTGFTQGLGYLMKEIGNFVLIGTSHQQQKK
jgi:hypothetical protein